MILHFLLAFLNSAWGTSFYIQPFSQFTHEAAAIVHGTLSNMHVEYGTSASGQKVIYTYATLEVKEVLKGQIATQSVLIREIGGTKDGQTLELPGSPEFKNGEDTVLFLGNENSDQSREIEGLELGKFGTETKGQAVTLTGGIFNYSKHSEHNAGEDIAENQQPWTLSDLRGLIEKQAGKDVESKNAASDAGVPRYTTASSSIPSSASNASAENLAHSETSDQKESEDLRRNSTFQEVAYAVFAIAIACILFFLFRKR